MAIRLKDIAEDLGVSEMTVSKVLRGKPDVGEATRQLVLQRAKQLNYRPNMLARGLALGKTSTAGLIVPDLTHPFFAEFARALAATLRTGGYALLMASSEEDPAIEEQEIRTLAQRGADVLLLASCWTESKPSRALRELSAPLILIDRLLKRVPAPFIGIDDIRAGEMAGLHLIGHGRERIAHIGARHLSTARDREAGLRQALQSAGRRLSRDLVLHIDRVEESGETLGRQAMRTLLNLRKPPDAVFCYNDATAIGAMDAVLDAGLRVPHDIAIMGCGNLRYAAHLRVPLTSIDQRTPELGRIAGEYALQLGTGKKQIVDTIRLEPTLVVRASTLPEPSF